MAFYSYFLDFKKKNLISSWNCNLGIFNKIKHCAVSFSFKAFKGVQICLVSLLKPNWEVKKMLAACQIPRPQVLRAAPDHIQGLMCNCSQNLVL